MQNWNSGGGTLLEVRVIWGVITPIEGLQMEGRSMGSENEYTNGGTFGTQHLKVHTLTCAWRSCELLKGPLVMSRMMPQKSIFITF